MNQADLKLLLSRPETPANSVLSVYLDVDQSQQPNLNRGFEKQLKGMMTSLRHTIQDTAELERFRKAAHHIESFVSTYDIDARGIVMFFDESDGFFRHGELQVRVENQARWNRELFLQPLAAVMDESEAYAVALVGKASVRLFLVSADGIDELVDEAFPSRQVRHLKTVGSDHLGSESKVQRKADERIRWNLRHIVGDIDWLMKSKGVGRLVLAGTPGIVAELREQLPKRLDFRVIGSIDLQTDAAADKVLAATRPVAETYERATEVQIVNEVVTEAAKHGKAVTGLGHTLKAVNQARVWQLLYSNEFRSPGFQCSKCESLFSVSRETCLYCGAEVRPVSDVVELAIEHALRRGATIEVVKGEASESLINAGGIGAFLNARTGNIEL